MEGSELGKVGVEMFPNDRSGIRLGVMLVLDGDRRDSGRGEVECCDMMGWKVTTGC